MARARTTLSGLQKHAAYAVVVQAYNSRGAGPASPPTTATTMEDGKRILNTSKNDYMNIDIRRNTLQRVLHKKNFCCSSYQFYFGNAASGWTELRYDDPKNTSTNADRLLHITPGQTFKIDIAFSILYRIIIIFQCQVYHLVPYNVQH